MVKMISKLARKQRHARVRRKVIGSDSRPRLNAFRSLNHIYAQIIDDSVSHTIVSASSLEPEIKEKTNKGTKTEKASLVGTLIAQRALKSGINRVAFDRGGYKYHGRVKALAEAARQAGLEF